MIDVRVLYSDDNIAIYIDGRRIYWGDEPGAVDLIDILRTHSVVKPLTLKFAELPDVEVDLDSITHWEKL